MFLKEPCPLVAALEQIAVFSEAILAVATAFFARSERCSARPHPFDF